ncbi:hypothetical protein DPMN_190069 [Dreissena polymorpha]|uniref:Uncharacterized protein n=1 Tax=Dreissena polymorpha TaxID=45954 RepID=A0A9D4DW23_DREPO|nr:hypothetical protein DPMN_190069 [Dreissena polymorpha]
MLWTKFRTEGRTDNFYSRGFIAFKQDVHCLGDCRSQASLPLSRTYIVSEIISSRFIAFKQDVHCLGDCRSQISQWKTSQWKTSQWKTSQWKTSQWKTSQWKTKYSLYRPHNGKPHIDCTDLTTSQWKTSQWKWKTSHSLPHIALTTMVIAVEGTRRLAGDEGSPTGSSTST